jgi:hypothetical protein
MNLEATDRRGATELSTVHSISRPEINPTIRETAYHTPHGVGKVS